MQHSHALLNICINPLLRSPAQAHVLEFNCLPFSQFHSQIPKIYTFQLSLHHSFLYFGSQCHPTANATQCLQHSPKAVQNIMNQMAYNMSVTVSSYIAISSSSSSPFGTTTLCGFSPSQPSLSKFFYPCCFLPGFLDLP